MGGRDKYPAPQDQTWEPAYTYHHVSRLGFLKQSRLHLGIVVIEKGAFGLPPTTVANFTLLYDL